MNRLRQQLNCTNFSSRKLMLLLIVTIIATINLTTIHSGVVATSSKNVTKYPSQVSYQPKELPRVNYTAYENTTLTYIKSDQQRKPQKSETAAPLNLILKDDSTKRLKKLRDDETIIEHSYNSSVLQFNEKKNHPNSSEELATSDSRFYPKILSPRSDEEYDTPTEDETSGGGDTFNDIYDEAGTNLSEQKVVKELTKMLSKGMAGATEQMKLDTLENWKRRQKERKVVKDTRAKLFEDLLTTAINSHPEKTKKDGKKRTKLPDNQRSNSPTPSPLFANMDTANLDPELAGDAETVVKHLQGLTSLIDGQTLANEEETSAVADDSSSANEDSSSNETDGESKPTKKPTDRPIVRQFKKIKNQISQRRKQLDQIKKIFNVDLSLNPKDGSLVGRSVPKKKKVPGVQEVGDFTIIDDTPSHSKYKKRSGASSKSSKMNELITYLRENPEILASVMAELTTDADSRSPSPSLIHSGSADDNIHQSPGDEQEISSRKSSILGSGPLKHNELERLLWDRARKTTRQIEQYNSDMADLPSSSIIMPSNVKSSRISSYEPQLDFYRPSYNLTLPPNAPTSTKSAEARLLESLRERQLLNLMKLDMVLAERQQASNRSQVFSVPNAPLMSSQTGDRSEPASRNNLTHEIHNRPSTQRQTAQRYHSKVNGHNSGMSDEEIVHHFMVMNGANAASQPNQNPINWRISQQPSVQSQKSSNEPHQNQYPPDWSTAFKGDQHQSQPLNRFKDWRDVSRSEASSSQRSDKNVQTNLSWVPYDLTTGGSSSVQQHGSPLSLAETHPLSRNNHRLSTNHNDSEQLLGLDGIHHVKDYVDSIVIKPDHHIISTHSVPYDDLLNPNTSIFMTRSSIAQKEGGSAIGANIEPEKESDHTTKTRISREDTDDRSKSDDESYDFENSTRRRTSAPVDYFSAYKRRDQLGDHTVGPFLSSSKKHRVVSEQSDAKYEAMGGMWA